MNCDGVANLLSAYLDGELSPGELLRVEEHLRRCHACADEVDSLRQTVALVASLEEVEVPASFQVSLHERLVALGPPPTAVRRAPAAPSPQRNVRRWAVPAAAAAAVAALAIGVTQLSGNGQLVGGLTGQPGIFVAPPDSVATNPTTPPVNGSQTGKEPDTTTTVTPPTTSVDVGQPPKSSTPPGTVDTGGSHLVTTPTDEVPPKPNLKPQLAYSFTLTVAGTLDPKVKDTLWFEYPVQETVNNDIVIKVPAKQEQIDKTQKRLAELFPGAAVTPATQDRAADIQAATLEVEQKDKAYQADLVMKETDEKLAADQAALEQAKQYLKIVQSQVTTAVFTIKFQPAH